MENFGSSSHSGPTIFRTADSLCRSPMDTVGTVYTLDIKELSQISPPLNSISRAAAPARRGYPFTNPSLYSLVGLASLGRSQHLTGPGGVRTCLISHAHHELPAGNHVHDAAPMYQRTKNFDPTTGWNFCLIPEITRKCNESPLIGNKKKSVAGARRAYHIW